MRVFIIGFITFFAAMPASCEPGPEIPDVGSCVAFVDEVPVESPCNGVLHNLRAAEYRWNAANVDSYTWTVELQCFCFPRPGPVEFTVVDGVVTDSSAETFEGYPQTVEELFAIIESEVDADSIEVEFDPEFGFPVVVNIDSSFIIADEERYFRTTGFRPLP